MTKIFRAVPLALCVLASLPIGAPASAAEECLSRPGKNDGNGHWYYRVDRPTGRHCWYQSDATPPSRSKASRAAKREADREEAAEARRKHAAEDRKREADAEHAKAALADARAELLPDEIASRPVPPKVPSRILRTADAGAGLRLTPTVAPVPDPGRAGTAVAQIDVDAMLEAGRTTVQSDAVEPAAPVMEASMAPEDGGNPVRTWSALLLMALGVFAMSSRMLSGSLSTVIAHPGWRRARQKAVAVPRAAAYRFGAGGSATGR